MESLQWPHDVGASCNQFAMLPEFHGTAGAKAISRGGGLVTSFPVSSSACRLNTQRAEASDRPKMLFAYVAEKRRIIPFENIRALKAMSRRSLRCRDCDGATFELDEKRGGGFPDGGADHIGTPLTQGQI